MSFSPSIVLDSGINLRECTIRGSTFEVSNFEDDFDCYDIDNEHNKDLKGIGEPVSSFATLEKTLEPLDDNGYVKKKILDVGGGTTLDETFTVSIVYSGYLEDEQEPFDMTTIHKPLRVDMKENGLLLGLQIALKSMLVGEYSVFLMSHEVMYGILGAPPKIKPKAKCVYYIKLVRSIFTPSEGEINYSESNMFHRVSKEVRRLFLSGIQLYKANNYSAAIQLFKKSTNMLHRCRLADEREEKKQEALLLKLYLNLAITYNKMKLPLKTCIACNEINLLTNIWNHPKALLQNAKALRMIGDFKRAHNKLSRALKLDPSNQDMKDEMELLNKATESYKLIKLRRESKTEGKNELTDKFKSEMNKLIEQFKNDVDIQKFNLPEGLNKSEVDYIEQICKENGIFFTQTKEIFALDKEKKQILTDDLDLYLD